MGLRILVLGTVEDDVRLQVAALGGMEAARAAGRDRLAGTS